MDISKSYEAKFVFLEHRSYIHGSSMTHGLFEAIRSAALGLRARLFLHISKSLSYIEKLSSFVSILKLVSH